MSIDLYKYEINDEDLASKGPSESVQKFLNLILQNSCDSLAQAVLYSAKARNKEKLDNDWKTLRTRIMESRGIEYFTVPSPKRQKSSTETVSPYVSAYTTVVLKFFDAKLDSRYYNFINDFIYLEQARREVDRESLEIVWRIIETQTEAARGSEEIMAVSILNRTCGFFEQLFIEKVIETTREDTLRKRVVAYAMSTTKRIANYRPEYDDGGLPLWAVLYTYMRGGLRNEFMEYITSCFLSKDLGRFFDEYFARGVLSNQSLEEILSILHSAENLDIFKRALLIIISRHNQEIDEVQDNSLEDYLWVKLKLVSIYDDATAEAIEYNFNEGCSNKSQLRGGYSLMHLADFQKYLIEFGPTHFNNSCALYATALVSALCYGEAIMYLKNLPDYSIQALHLSLVLKEAGLLPMFIGNERMFDDIEGITHVNFNKMLSDYIKNFSARLPNEALVYISFMTSSQYIVNEASSLVMASDNFYIVTNKDAYIFSTSFRKAVGDTNYSLAVESIANYAVSQKSREASRLYDLIGQPRNVLLAWIVEMKQEIHILSEKWKNEYSKIWNLKEERGESPKINYPAAVYPGIYDRYQQQGIFASNRQLELGILILNCFLTFYTALNARQFRYAILTLSEAKIFPIRPITEHSTIISIMKDVPDEAKEEVPRVIFNLLEVHWIIFSRGGHSGNLELKNDMNNLIAFFEDLYEQFKHLPSVIGKFTQYNMPVKNIRNMLMVS